MPKDRLELLQAPDRARGLSHEAITQLKVHFTQCGCSMPAWQHARAVPHCALLLLACTQAELYDKTSRRTQRAAAGGPSSPLMPPSMLLMVVLLLLPVRRHF